MGSGDFHMTHFNGGALRAYMKCESAQSMVNSSAEAIREAANANSRTYYRYGPAFTVHPKVLRVSAHAFVDPTGITGCLAESRHECLSQAFWTKQGMI